MSLESSPSEVFKGRLRAARDLRGYSQSVLAERAGLPPSSIAHFEAGARKPSFENLRRLATALDVTTDYLLGRVEDPSMAEDGDPLFRDLIGKLSGNDRDLAEQLLKVLAKRNRPRKD